MGSLDSAEPPRARLVRGGEEGASAESSVNPVCEGDGKTLMLVGQGGVDGRAQPPALG